MKKTNDTQEQNELELCSIEQVVTLVGDGLERPHIEAYIKSEWVRPVEKEGTWHFESIDVERTRLVHTLHHAYQIDEEAMELVLSLLDQLYGTREQMRRLVHAVEHQPRYIQAEIFSVLSELENDQLG